MSKSKELKTILAFSKISLLNTKHTTVADLITARCTDKGFKMKPSAISKYYDLRYDLHRSYISPVEFKKTFLNKPSAQESYAVDTVSISKEAKIKYENTYGKYIQKHQSEVKCTAR